MEEKINHRSNQVDLELLSASEINDDIILNQLFGDSKESNDMVTIFAKMNDKLSSMKDKFDEWRKIVEGKENVKS